MGFRAFIPVQRVVSKRLCSTSPRLEIDNDAFRKQIQSMASGDIHLSLDSGPASANLLDPSDTFASRHLGSSSKADIEKMCSVIGVDSVDHLIAQTIPAHVVRDQTKDPLLLHEDSMSESKTVEQLRAVAARNRVGTNFLGQGYHGTISPGVIVRNLLENPAWYTAYTPYQAEISQGRLEGLFIYQTLVANLTGMEVSNCSLLDEGTSAAEAMAMFARGANNRNLFFVSSAVHPQTIDVVKTRAVWMNVDLVFGDHSEFDFKSVENRLLGALVQFPDTLGRLTDYSQLAACVHAAKGKLCVAADPLALTVCEPPVADAVVGTMQRFGVPMWSGGPHAGFLATKMSEVRRMPGRLIGKSVDSRGNAALRLTLQTREQHIRLDKATSNICTSQALLANISAMYAVYHGPAGLQRIGCRVHALGQLFAAGVSESGIGEVENGDCFFDAVTVNIAPVDAQFVKQTLNGEYAIQVRMLDADRVQVSFDETHTEADVDRLVEALANCMQQYVDSNVGVVRRIDGTKLSGGNERKVDGLVEERFRRRSNLLPEKIFNSIQTETDMMRYLYRLQLKDLSLTSSMITLGSCTMKLNSASSLMPCSWPEFANIHPFAPPENTKGYRQLLHELEQYLCTITGFDVCSLQPSSGASGEYAGLLAIRRYLGSIGEGKRNVVIIPKSAHGTNSASAAMMGMQIKWIEDTQGIDIELLRSLCETHKDSLAALMVTYPSTHGKFDSNIQKICQLIHEFGGQVYMDGANMNAQLGLTSPGVIGADVCHLNLHKTFSIPHGGGGPGMGPICARAHLGPFLPGHCQEPSLLPSASGSVSSAPYGQAGIAAIPWMFITMLGAKGLTESGKQAILNANYMASRLKEFYPMPFLNKMNRCSHEFIIDVSEIKEKTGVGEEDIAKRLMDYGFHAPTMSWPVHASLMIEPTESENVQELDRFVEAMISVRKEIEKIQSGEWDKKDNPLKNAPHTQAEVCASEWKHKSYSREEAAFPLPWIRERGKFWPSVSRVSNAVGDKTLVLRMTE